MVRERSCGFCGDEEVIFYERMFCNDLSIIEARRS